MLSALSASFGSRLEGLGMGEHTALFHGAEVDMSILPFFREKDCTVSSAHGRPFLSFITSQWFM